MPKPYPWYYAVNDRPVKIVLTPEGGADCLVFDFATGGFVVDRSYFSYTTPGSGKDVDQLTEEEFEQLVAWQREEAFKRRRETLITWRLTLESDPVYDALYWAEYQGRRHTIRVNDFPAEPLYTLLVDGQEVEDLEEWPPAWVRPAIP